MNCNNPVIMNTFCTQFHFTFPYIPEKKKYIKTIIIIYLFLSDFIVYNSVFPYSLYTSGSGFELRGILIALELGRFLFDPPLPLHRPMKSCIVKENHIGSAASEILFVACCYFKIRICINCIKYLSIFLFIFLYQSVFLCQQIICEVQFK